jgi:hypothetical protein
LFISRPNRKMNRFEQNNIPFPKPIDIINNEVDWNGVNALQSTDALFRDGKPQDHPYYTSYTNGNAKFDYWKQFKDVNYSYTTNNASVYKGLGDLNDTRYAVWTPRERYLTLMSPKSLEFIQTIITRMLTGVHPEGKKIVVPIDTIKSVADSVYTAAHQDVNVMQKMIISFIVDTIKTEYVSEQRNSNLSIWVTKYDEESGMKQFNDVKLNQKMRLSDASFQWRY